MSRMKNYRVSAVVLAALMSSGCNLPKTTTRKAVTTLPSSYGQGASDEPSSALIEWRDFFSDPNLLALIEIAIESNKEINIAMQRITVARNEIQARRGEYMPFVNAIAGVGADKVGEYTRDGAVEEGLRLPEEREFPTMLGDFKFGLFSTWEVDIWKKLHNAAKVAVYDYMATQEGRNFLVSNLVAEVARSYYELLALDNQLQNLEQNIEVQQSGLEMVRQLQEYARSDTLAVKRYEAEVAKNQARRFEISQQITVVENQLNFLLGRTPQPIPRSSEGFMEFKPATLVTGVPSELLLNRPDIRQAELELMAAELDIRVARANFYPRFDIRAGLGFNAFTPRYLLKTPESVIGSIAGDLVAPLINRKAITAEYKNASARQIQAAFEYEQRIINAYVEVANQLASIANLEKNLEYKRSQVGLLSQSIEAATELFKSARIDYLDVLLTQREVLEARKELIETKLKQIAATVDLYKALGGGWRRTPAQHLHP